MKKIVFLVLLASIPFWAQSQIDPLLTKDMALQQRWVDSVMGKLSTKQKIGQLFMAQAYSNKDTKHRQEMLDLIAKYQIGGLIFMQGTPEKQLALYNDYQKASQLPLLIGFDGEWGLNMRLKNSFRYPWNMTLGAIKNNKLIEQFGRQVGKHCKRVGIHINFAPVVDINTNPANPIIGNRSFGEDKYNVAAKASAFVKGMQSAGVLANAKHFPGHGDTATDSHKTLPVLTFDKARLDSIELFPYRKMFESDLGSVMVAHLDVTALGTKPGLPTSLSKKVITDLLQQEMGFKGLIFTDALNMKGASNYAKAGEVDLAAFAAGNDMLLIPEDVAAGVKKIQQAVDDGTISISRLDASVRKILKTKYWAGLHAFKPLAAKGLQQDIQTVEDRLLFRKLMANAITLVKNEKQNIPIRHLEKEKIAYLPIGDADHKPFLRMLRQYSQVDLISDANSAKALDSYTKIIVGYHRSNDNPWKPYKMSAKDRSLLEIVAAKHQLILTVFSSPYALLPLNLKSIETVVVAYQNNTEAQELSAQMLFGALPIKGCLPVGISDLYPASTGIEMQPIRRLSYGLPEEVGMQHKKLARIDSVMKLVIDKKMAPGGQVLVARHGKVVYQKSFGHFSYLKKHAVENSDIYDLASITKILGGLPILMKHWENGGVHLDAKLGELLPYLQGSNKADVVLREALSHAAGLKPWIPFYKETVNPNNAQPLADYYRKKPEAGFQMKVADGLYLRNSFLDTIYKRIAEVPNLPKKDYKYSGLVFYLLNRYLQNQCGETMDKMNHHYFYAPLGATTLGYNPLDRFSKNRIVPSEQDNYFRQQLLQGHVHDMGAAMMQGVNGNAGLFGNANDVAKMMQMYLQKGYYGGMQYLEANTLATFNKRYFANRGVRRGLVFDKPQLDPKVLGTSKYATNSSFGHSGFTGTYTWADPEQGLVYVFLTNRTYPNMNNNQLGKENIRTSVLDLVYEAIGD
ncbi:MAG: serine hydrolase [Flavobacteriaceae bacterium]|nr:serine hydrolase [Flavobacteriaceae bacterium]